VPVAELQHQRSEQDGHDNPEVQFSAIHRAARAPNEAHHAAPEMRRHSMPPISSAKAAIGSMTKAVVNNVILSRISPSSRNR
jgi:hypothetical protein